MESGYDCVQELCRMSTHGRHAESDTEQIPIQLR